MHYFGVAQPIQEARLIVLQHGKLAGHDYWLKTELDRSLARDFDDGLRSGGHAEWARRWHCRNKEMLLLVGHVQRHHESGDANELAIQRQYLAAERRDHFAVALDGLHLRQRLPRHHALQLG